MPQVQVVDLGRDQSKGKGLMGFLNELGDTYKEGRDKETFNNLLGEYEKNKQEEGAYEKLQVDLMKSNIAPTRRLELQGQLNEMQEGIIKKQKSFNDKIETKANLEKEKNEAKKNEIKAANQKKETKSILLLGGDSEEEAEAKSDYYTPASARFEAGKKLGTKPQDTVLKGTKGQDKRREETEEKGLKARKLLLEAPKLKQAIQNLGKEGRSIITQSLSNIPVIGREAAEKTFGANEQTINSIVKESLLKSGDLAGLRLTDYKLRYLEGAMPSPYKTLEANEAAYDLWEKTQQLSVKLQEEQNKFIKELQGLGRKTLPVDYDLQLQERLDKAGLNKELDNLVEEAKKAPENPEAEKRTGLKSPPPAEENKGKKIKDDKTGQVYKSNGKTWEPI